MAICIFLCTNTDSLMPSKLLFPYRFALPSKEVIFAERRESQAPSVVVAAVVVATAAARGPAALIARLEEKTAL